MNTAIDCMIQDPRKELVHRLGDLSESLGKHHTATCVWQRPEVYAILGNSHGNVHECTDSLQDSG